MFFVFVFLEFLECESPTVLNVLLFFLKDGIRTPTSPPPTSAKLVLRLIVRHALEI